MAVEAVRAAPEVREVRKQDDVKSEEKKAEVNKAQVAVESRPPTPETGQGELNVVA